MARQTALLIALAAGAALAATSFASPNRGVAANSGDSFTGAVDFAGDEDGFVMDLSEGGTLTAKVKGDKAAGLLPTLKVLRPDGSTLSTTGFTKGDGTLTLSLKKLPLDATGLWAVVVSGASGTTGTFKVTLSTKAPLSTKSPGHSVGDGAVEDIEFTGMDGGLVTLSVIVKSGPGIAAVALVDPDGTEVPGAAALILAGTGKFTGKKIPLGQGYGRYALRLTGNAGGATTADVKIAVKAPKVAKRKVVLGAEPRVLGANPSGAAAGSSIALQGTGFAAGARAWFEDLEGTPVIVATATAATVPAPGGFNTAQNIVVSITMQNADGQVGVLVNGFTYRAVPTVSGVSPALSPLAGGTTLTVTGTDFRSGAAVTVGGSAATSVLVANSTTITCTTPAHAAGAAGVVVTDEFGRSTASASGHSYVAGPTASGV